MNWIKIEQEIGKWKKTPEFTKQSLQEYQKNRQILSNSFRDLEKYYAEQNHFEPILQEFSDALKTASSLCHTRSLMLNPEICRLVTSCLISKYNLDEKSTNTDMDIDLSSSFWCLENIRQILKPRNSSIIESSNIAQDCGLSLFEVNELILYESIDTLVSFIDDTLKIFPQFPSELLPLLCIDCLRLCASPHSIGLVEKVLSLCTRISQNDIAAEDSSAASKQDFMEALIKEIVFVNRFVYDGLDQKTRKNLCLFSHLVLEHEIICVVDKILFGRYLKPSDIRGIIRNSWIYQVILENPDAGIQAFDFLVNLVQKTSDWRVVRALIGWNQCLFEDSLANQLPKFYPEYLARLINILCRPPKSPHCYEDFLNLRDQILNGETSESLTTKAHCVWLLSLSPLCWREKVYSWISNIEQYASLFMLEGPLTFCSWLSHPSEQSSDDLINLASHSFAKFLRSHLPFDKTSIDDLVLDLEKILNVNSRTFITIEQMLKIANDTNRLDVLAKLVDTCGIHSRRETICDMSTCTIILDFWNEMQPNSVVHTEPSTITELTEMYNAILC